MIDSIFNYFIHLPKWYFTVLTALFVGFIGLCVYAGKNYFSASKQFRNTIYTELEGIHPAIHAYIPTDEINTKIWQSIPKIVTAASEFSHFLPTCCKRTFSRAVEHYCDTARKTNWNSQVDDDFYPEMRKPGEINTRDKLKHAVDNLLKFAK